MMVNNIQQLHFFQSQLCLPTCFSFSNSSECRLFLWCCFMILPHKSVMFLCFMLLFHYWAEPYDFVGWRGHKEPAALASVSVKRVFVENSPYLVSGYRQNGSLSNASSCNELVLKSFSSNLQKMKARQSNTPISFDSMAEKYQYMRKTFKKRLAFGEHLFAS